MSDKKLEGKVARVTRFSGSGLGREFTRALGQAEANVVMIGFNAEACKTSSKED